MFDYSQKVFLFFFDFSVKTTFLKLFAFRRCRRTVRGGGAINGRAHFSVLSKKIDFIWKRALVK